MHRPLRNLPRLLLASTVAFAAVATGAPAGERIDKPSTLIAPPPTHPVAAGAKQNGIASCAALAGPLKVASDPEEGGQIARSAKPKPQVSDLTVAKRTDTASTKLMVDAAPASTCPPVQH